MKPQEAFPVDHKQIQHLKSLVAQGEGFHLEFKRKAAHPDKIVREMIAFANSKGGILLVGIGDEGTIPGLKYPEDDSHEIKKALRQSTGLEDIGRRGQMGTLPRRVEKQLVLP